MQIAEEKNLDTSDHVLAISDSDNLPRSIYAITEDILRNIVENMVMTTFPVEATFSSKDNLYLKDTCIYSRANSSFSKHNQEIPHSRKSEYSFLSPLIEGKILEISNAHIIMLILHGNIWISTMSLLTHKVDTIEKLVVEETKQCLWKIGHYILMSLSFCPCHAFEYQVLRQGKSTHCKHILVLRLVMLLEVKGFFLFRQRGISHQEFLNHLLRG